MLKQLYDHIRETGAAFAIVPSMKETPYMTDDAFEYGARPEHLNHFVNESIAGKIMKAMTGRLSETEEE